MKHHTAYIICAVQRSGTQYLSDGLQQTGIAGKPSEYFQIWNDDARVRSMGLTDNLDYLNWALEQGTSINGVFGCVMMWDYFGYALFKINEIPKYIGLNGFDALKQIFSNLHFIYLTRQDKLRQAISMSKAQQTKIYSVKENQSVVPNQTPRFNYEQINWNLNRIYEGESGWERFFASHRIDPLKIVYEDIVNSYRQHVLRILEYLKIPHYQNLTFKESSFKKMSDNVTEKWIREYKKIKSTAERRKPAVALITAHGWVGISTPVVMTAKYLAHKGFDVDLFISEDAFCHEMGIAIPQFTETGITLHTSNIKGYDRVSPKNPNDPEISPADLEFVDRYKNPPKNYDWMIGFDPGGLIRAALLSQYWKVPYIYHSLELHNEDDSIKALERQFSQKAILVLTQDKLRANLLSSLNHIPRDKIQISYNSALGDILATPHDYFRQKFNIPVHEKIVLATGTLLPIHSIDKIIDSVAQWPDEFCLVLHGWIPDEKFKAYISEKIHSNLNKIFLSTEILEQEKKDIIFQSVDIGLVFFEPVEINYEYAAGSSGKLYDFMRCGVPIIGNDIPGMRELVEKNGIGVVVKNAKEIGKVLPDIISNYAVYERNCFETFPHFEFGQCYDSILNQILLRINSFENKSILQSLKGFNPLANSDLPEKEQDSQIYENVDQSKLRESDVLIASFPRSGNTWTRNLLTDIILQLHNISTDTNQFEDVERVIPDIYLNKLDEIDPRIKLPFRLIKTHEKFNPGVKKHICVFRNPADTLCSFYHYKRDIEKCFANDDIDNFCLNNFVEWQDHLKSFLSAHEKKQGNILFVSYEWLHRDTIGALLAMAEFLKFPVSRSMCEKAVNNQKFKKHKRQSKRFYRKGIIGSSLGELKIQTVQFIDNKAESLYNKAEALQKYRQINEISSGNTSSNYKIVHLCTHDFGGAGKACYRLHKGLRQIGVDSTMLVLNKRSRDPSVKVLPSGNFQKTAKCLDILTCASPIWSRQLLRWKSLLRKYTNRPVGLEIFTDAYSDIKLHMIHELRKADIIHLHWVAGIMDYGTAPLFLGKKPLVWTLHDMNPFTGGCHYSGDCQKYKIGCGACPQLGSYNDQDLSHRIWKQKSAVYDNFNLSIVSPSQWLGDCAVRSKLFSRFSFRVLANGLPLNVFKPYPKSEIRRALNISGSAKVILFGAESIDNKRKGFDYLGKAINQLSTNGEDNVVIITFGHVSTAFNNSSKYSVMNFGPIDDESRLAKIYSLADVFVIPSIQDNLPNTVIEAMACGVPVVGFNVGGISEIIDHKKTGFLADPQNVEGLTEGIQWVTSSSGNEPNFLKRCREKALRNYAIESQAAKYNELYKAIIQENLEKETLQFSDELVNYYHKNDGKKNKYLPSHHEYELGNTIKTEELSVSAIVSAFNSKRFMRGRLENLVAQTLYKKKQLEIIIVDSNSSQNERAIVQEFMNQYDNIEYIYTSRKETVYGAWNRGIRLSKGNYFINANTDDRFAPDALERMADELDGDSNIAAVYGDWLVTRVENDDFQSASNKFRFNYPEFFGPLFFYYQITSHAPMMHKDLFDQIGLFDDRLRVFGDRDFMFRFATSGLKAKKIPGIVGLYLESPESLEHAEAGAASEFAAIRNHFLQPHLFVKLFGYDQIPDAKKLGELYAITGSLGNAFYTCKYRVASDFLFAARLFCKALGFDPTNIMAMNNLGIIMCIKGKPQDAIKHFESALEADASNNGRQLKDNLTSAEAGSTILDNYSWFRHKAYDQASPPDTIGNPSSNPANHINHSRTF
jgi:glycosyltransferase involved in cell wall biosynthesis